MDIWFDFKLEYTISTHPFMACFANAQDTDHEREVEIYLER